MIFILTVLLSFVTVAAGFIVYHFSKAITQRGSIPYR